MQVRPFAQYCCRSKWQVGYVFLVLCQQHVSPGALANMRACTAVLGSAAMIG